MTVWLYQWLEVMIINDYVYSGGRAQTENKYMYNYKPENGLVFGDWWVQGLDRH